MGHPGRVPWVIHVRRVLLLALSALSALSACHAATAPRAPDFAVELPPAPPPPQAASPPAVGPPHFAMVVDFAALRAHPAAGDLSTLVAALPGWRQTLAGSGLDPIRDCDWLSIEGADVRDSSEDVVLVHYSARDADVEAAIDRLVSRSAGGAGASFDAGEPSVRAWRMRSRAREVVFLRPESDHVIAIVPVADAGAWAGRLARGPAQGPARAGLAVDIHATRPHELVPMMPAAFSEERITVAAEGAGARLHVEGDCADEASARAAAEELERGVLERNTLGVKLATKGAFKGFRARGAGSKVVADVAVSADQLEAVLRMTALAEGAALPRAGGAPSP